MMARYVLKSCPCEFTIRDADARHRRQEMDDWIAAGRSDTGWPHVTLVGPHEVAWTEDGDPILTIPPTLDLMTAEGSNEAVRLFRAWHDADPSRCMGKAEPGVAYGLFGPVSNEELPS